MTSNLSSNSNHQHEKGSKLTLFSASLLLFPIWIIMAVQLLWVQELWFDPWDTLPPPPAGTVPATLNPLIKGPLFIIFAIFVLGGSVGLALWKVKQSAERASLFRKIFKTQAIGLLAFTSLIFISSFPIANLWSQPINNLSFQEYVNYNHIIRTAPFIALGFLLFASLYSVIWRIK